jgi:thiamine-phosphate pyrophosphorylase
MADDENYCGIYLITPEVLDDLAHFCKELDKVLATDFVDCVQLRLKNVSDEDITKAALALLPVCHKYEVPMLVNDRADIAAAVDADGVHLGQNDGDVAAARTLLGADKDIGVTCHSSKHLAFEAGEAGANYVAFGAFFKSDTKRNAETAEISVLTDWDEVTDIAAVAIGGVTAENCGALKAAGAHLIAVSSFVWNHPDGSEKAIRLLRSALDVD